MDLIAGSEEIKEDRLVHSFLAEFKVVPVNRRFGAVFRWDIQLSASGGQNVQDAVEQPVGVAAGPADVRLRWGYFRTISQKSSSISWNARTPGFYLRGHIILGSPQNI